MRTLVVEDGFADWRGKARDLLAAEVAPEKVLWEDGGAEGLFGALDGAADGRPPGEPPTVPREFVDLAKTVSHHASPERWGLLYRVLWRLTHGGERDLLRIASDADVARLQAMRKAVGRDVHKMHAFVRFKKVGEDAETGRERFVAWFEPDHRIMPLAAPFFRKRFAGMDWTIFTPTGSAHWDGKSLQHGPGVASMQAPDDMELEELWKSYYKSIFNPARLKVKAMQAEMPKKYWNNLPEAELVGELIAGGGRRVAGMMREEASKTRDLPKNAYLRQLNKMNALDGLAVEPGDHVGEPLAALKKAASACRACPLHENATATVFGEGPEDAAIMMVGEQPGDQEDLTGGVFVGPAGRLLDKALAEAGINREMIYLTNAVKHFKWERDGKRRLHQTPNMGEVGKCRPWLLAELMQVKPRTLVCLGATAARSLLDPGFRLVEERGLIKRPDLAEIVVATVHPAHLLRHGHGTHGPEWTEFVADLRQAR